jgi:NADH-quinone oxidoreductase subunit N
VNAYYTPIDHFALTPALLLALFGAAVLLFDFFVVPKASQKRWLAWMVVGAEVFTGGALYRQYEFLRTQGITRFEAFDGTLAIDGFSIFFNALFAAAAALVAIVSYRYLEVEDEHDGAYYGLVLFAQCGMFFLASGTDLITLFVGLELMALSFYVLTGFLRRDRRSNEAALKYMLLGALSSGFLAYGFSLFYALSGSTKVAMVAAAVRQRGLSDPLLILALAAAMAGALFKVGAAPFHMWAPDAYEGAPTPVSAYLSVASKAASFAFLVRLLMGPLGESRAVWEPWLAGVAVLSLAIGNFSAMSQTSMKRLLAFSSVSHAGYVLLGVIAGNDTGVQGVAVYLLTYTFMTVGAFLVLTVLRQAELGGDEIHDLAGLYRRAPAHAVAMLIFLLALAGIPPTSGFIAKYFIFLALIETGHTWLAAMAALYVAVSLYYYFRMVKTMFTGEAGELPGPVSSAGATVAFAVTAGMTVLIGVYPEPFLRFASGALLK